MFIQISNVYTNFHLRYFALTSAKGWFIIHSDTHTEVSYSIKRGRVLYPLKGGVLTRAQRRLKKGTVFDGLLGNQTVDVSSQGTPGKLCCITTSEVRSTVDQVSVGKSEACGWVVSVSSIPSWGSSSMRCNDVLHLSIRVKSTIDHCILYALLNIMGASNRQVKRCKTSSK